MLEAGQTAPDFTLPDQDGEELTLSELRGQTVVLRGGPRRAGRTHLGLSWTQPASTADTAVDAGFVMH
jgi:thioredoxin-dependent peroxiredoxin